MTYEKVMPATTDSSLTTRVAIFRPTVLSVLPDTPFPAHTGLHLRMVNNLDLVRRLGCESHVLLFLSEERPPSDPTHAELRRMCDSVIVGPQRRPQSEFSTAGLVSHKLDFLIRGGLGLGALRYPFSMRYDAVGAEQRVLVEARRVQADFVVLPSFMIHYAESLTAAGFRVIADAIDVLTELTASLLKTYSAQSRFGRFSLLANHWACRTQEKRFLPKCVEIWATTAKEGESLGQIAPRSNVIVVSNGMDEQTVRPGPWVEDDTVGFIGTYSMLPNVEAACFLAEKVLPELLRLRPTARLRLAGAHMPPEIAARLRGLGYVDLLGTVRDSAELFDSSRVIGLPVFVHGGTPLKLVEAMARGKAVVASAGLATNLPVTEGHDLLLADEPAAFALALARVLSDRPENERLGRNARETFLKTWSRASAEAIMRRTSALAAR